MSLSSNPHRVNVSCWPIDRETTMFQARSPEIAKLLSRRVGFRQVGYNVTGRFLRLFVSEISLGRAQKLIERLQAEVSL
jgi:hypothetical protein